MTHSALLVAAGADRFGLRRGLGISTIAFKVTPQDSAGLLILENTFHAKGGPPRHLHHAQDEWFYAVEGAFLIEIGDDRMTLGLGDAVLAPRGVPHVWAAVGDQGGRMVIVFQPAGQMEDFFRVVTAADAMPPQDPELWHAHGMDLLGPPLAVECGQRWPSRPRSLTGEPAVTTPSCTPSCLTVEHGPTGVWTGAEYRPKGNVTSHAATPRLNT